MPNITVLPINGSRSKMDGFQRKKCKWSIKFGNIFKTAACQKNANRNVLRFYLTSGRIAIIQKTVNSNAGKDVESEKA